MRICTVCTFEYTGTQSNHAINSQAHQMVAYLLEEGLVLLPTSQAEINYYSLQKLRYVTQFCTVSEQYRFVHLALPWVKKVFLWTSRRGFSSSFMLREVELDPSLAENIDALIGFYELKYGSAVYQSV